MITIVVDQKMMPICVPCKATGRLWDQICMRLSTTQINSEA